MSPSRVTLTLAVLVACCAVSLAQVPDRERRRKALLEGTHVLRRMLHDKGFKALNGFEDLKDDPKRTLLVVLGDLEHLDFENGGLKAFLDRGGAALIASDRAIAKRASSRALLDSAGVSIQGNTITVHPKEAYNGIDYCPVLLPADNPVPNLFEKPLTVVANVPSMLVHHDVVGRPIVMLPESSALEQVGPGGAPFPLRMKPLFGVSAQHSNGGRILVFADHSLFINEMMVPRSTNNVEFTYLAIDWLKDEERDRVLFVEEGQVQTKLDIPLKSVDLPIAEVLWELFNRREALARMADEKIVQLDRAGTFGPNIVDWLERHEFKWTYILAGAAVVITVVMLSFMLYRLGFLNRFSFDSTTEPLSQEVGQRLPQVPLAAQRVEAMLAGQDARDVLRAVARNWLRAQGVEPPTRPIDETPEFTLAGGWWARLGLSGRLVRIWKMAAGAYPSAVPPAEAEWWQREMDDLSSRRKQGEWGPPAPPPQRRTDDELAA